METKYTFVKSTDNIHNLSVKIYIPDGNIKGIFQLVHGMTEYKERYDDFLTFLCGHGYLCVSHDHLGHGKSVNDDSELGFIAQKDGWKLLVEDVKAVADYIKTSYNTKKHYLLGHSMGSFVTRLYAEKYGQDLSGYVMMGSGYCNPMSDMGILLAKLLSFFKGKRYVSSFMYAVAFGSYNNRFKEEKDNYSWLTRKAEIRDKYRKDKYTSFRFSVSAITDLITLNKECNRKEWFENINKELPIFILSGEDDPVGEYKKGITKVYNKLTQAGSAVKMKLYSEARHEILNELNFKEVYIDILNFLTK